MKLLITLLLVSANVFANGITAKGEQANGVVIALTDEPCKIRRLSQPIPSKRMVLLRMVAGHLMNQSC
jgi:hypothetical protein